MQGLYLECPAARWGPVTRGMARMFRNALKFSGYTGFNQGVPKSVRVHLGGDVEQLSESSEDSVTLSSADDAVNQTLFFVSFLD